MTHSAILSDLGLSVVEFSYIVLPSASTQLYLDFLPDDGVVDAQLVEMPPQGFEGPLVALGRAAVLVVSVRPGILHNKNRCRLVQSRYMYC